MSSGIKIYDNTQTIPAMSDSGVEKVRLFESFVREQPQETIHTDHVLHGGMYVRTMFLRAGVVMTSVLIKIPTTVITQGDVDIFADQERPLRVSGYNVLPASPHRKIAVLAREDTYLTMTFPTDAKTVEDAEKQFTDEFSLLMSNTDDGTNTRMVTGE